MTTMQTSKLSAAQQQLIAKAAGSATGAVDPTAESSGKPLSKSVTKRVEALLGLGLVREVRTKADLPLWRQDESGKRYSLVLTKSGQAAAAEVARVTEKAEEQPATERSYSANAGDANASASATDIEATPPRSSSKLAGIIDLLQRPEGAPVSALMAATGWLPHTTRAALTGLRKRGYTVVREAAEGGSVYRIQGDATAAAA